MRTKSIRKAKEILDKKKSKFAKLTRYGFLIEDEIFDHLEVMVKDWHIVRKYFDQEGNIICFSRDGYKSSEGFDCEGCICPECQPRVRMNIKLKEKNLLLELNYTSSKNFISFVETTAPNDEEINRLSIGMTVINRGYWGEVMFMSYESLEIQE